jgi:hypothetical protein
MTTPDPRPRRSTLRDARHALAARHALHYEVTGICPPPHRWADCEQFTLARLRGVGHTVYVVQDPADYSYRVIDWCEDGPVAGTGADIYPPGQSWADAVLAALRLVLGDAEFAETISGGTALGLAARALAEADAAAAADPGAGFLP